MNKHVYFEAGSVIHYILGARFPNQGQKCSNTEIKNQSKNCFVKRLYSRILFKNIEITTDKIIFNNVNICLHKEKLSLRIRQLMIKLLEGYHNSCIHGPLDLKSDFFEVFAE